ncbi:MAG: hypothetical protein ACTHPO_01515 [Alphaproteobacteria bacterium]
MSNLEKLEELTTYAVAFKEAAEAYTSETDGLQEDMIAKLEDGEMDRAIEMATNLATGGLSAAFGGVSEDFLLLNIEAADFTTLVAGRVIDQDTLISFLPEELKTQESVDQLEQAKAPNLARICKAAL